MHFYSNVVLLMWKLQATELYERRHKRFQKDNPRELQAVLDNLDTYVNHLMKELSRCKLSMASCMTKDKAQ